MNKIETLPFKQNAAILIRTLCDSLFMLVSHTNFNMLFSYTYETNIKID